MRPALPRWTALLALATFAAAPTRATQSAPRGATIQGRTINAITREPVRGAMVYARLFSKPGSVEPPDVQFLTGPEGQFVLRDLPSGTYDLYAAKTGYVDKLSERLSIESGVSKSGIEIALTPAATISGTVMTQFGVPRPLVRIRATMIGGSTEYPLVANTDLEGRYNIGGLEAGDYVVAMFSSGNSVAQQTAPIPVRASEERAGVDFVVTDGSTRSHDTQDDRTSEGRALIAGIVRDRGGRGLSGVSVGVETAPEFRFEPASRYTTSTDGDGRFRVNDVPPGRYRVIAVRTGHEMLDRGVMPGTIVNLSAGQSIGNLAVTMTKLATLSGTARDQYGDPLSVSVGIAAVAGTGLASSRRVTSDSHGRYRLAGLRPGEYLIAIDKGTLGQNLRTVDESGAERSVGYRAMYYPGVPEKSLATFVKVADADIDGLDFTVRPVLATTLAVTVDLAGRAIEKPQLQIVDITTDPAGRVFDTGTLESAALQLVGSLRLTMPVPIDSRPAGMYGMTAGRYRLIAFGDERNGNGDLVRTLWAQQEIASDGQTPLHVRLSLEPGARVSGRMRFNGASPNPTAVASLQSTPWIAPPLTVSARAAGDRGELSFTIDSVPPGRYWLDGALPATARPTWMLTRVTAGGRDIFDEAIDLSPGEELDDVVLTFSDRASATEVTGTVTDAAGRPVGEALLVLFSTDARYWRFESHHVRTALSDFHGRFAVVGLPPGDYRAALVPVGMSFNWPATLPKLVGTGLPFTLGDGEHKVVDVRRAP
jgi:protocatechuate 3,4-dioxygenase beta subunit